ncbi:hypothetical protein KEM48_007312 [Puccinia striiformis f. sp. tritici PST-130]|nr:hypothetical protein KEM48_007312 [Puccinia striiformis f. sp. tritici PST-130]
MPVSGSDADATGPKLIRANRGNYQLIQVACVQNSTISNSPLRPKMQLQVQLYAFVLLVATTLVAAGHQRRVVFYEAKLAHAGPIPFHFDCLNTDEENRYCCRRALYPEAVNGDTLTVRQDEFEHGLPGEFLGDLNCYPAPADH